ncbi:MAG TPA: sugar phosphate isomerase/epimerase [Clostridia bacterium]|nr:sugar phosphate isomerase/epimerase [Clostridia bacterium]
MKLGVLTVLFSNLTLEDTLKKLKPLGVQTVELGCGGYPGTAHADAAHLLENPDKITALLELVKGYGMEISAFSCHGNPVHPDKEIASAFDKDFRNAVLLAEKAGIDTVITFSGCPGDSRNAKYPNWVTCPWPDDFGRILEYQWNDVLIPYWKEAVKFARDHGIHKIGLEMHPGFCVYNPESLLKLRSAVGPEIGANFDPSHLFWQGIDPVMAIRALKGCIWHFHAKDCKVMNANSRINGVLDTKHYGDEFNRSWIFRTMGYGHGQEEWNEIFSTLKMAGYDGAISIEHEDSLMSSEEGLEKAISFLKGSIIFRETGEMYWA